MREYKFRGKRNDGEWVYGNLVTYFNKPAIQDYAETNGEIFLVDPETVGQYTGQKDKNEKEIYEGDIVHFLDAYMYGEDGDWDECSCIGVIKWDDSMAQFYVTNRNSMDNDDFWEQIDEFQVIGNIYENPELLEVQTDVR